MLVQRVGGYDAAQFAQYLTVLANCEPGVGQRVPGFVALVE